ncbi:molybdate ABC transporter substrate-binding protein [Mycobacterium vicinigordonae]|uniref:Molybdate ABC transporter substrate-binding protein n=1 Tax=Mycobacterium vicinigordonae TaxID=1719132 RepID=A0A7D6E1E0_9MYCO|nr:molybdate ABC transporter substrate-binding protein [Mycobacterium vicinigordonae]QLL05162.1 molybdate ABC transporter substrate-binding protein [Mycobacterium vicinigordonae]
MRRIGFLTGLVTLLLVGGVAACHSSSPSGRSIVVFAAASLNKVFTQIGERFKADNPGTDVKFNFAGSSDLSTQLVEGATADAFASADTAQMDKVAKAGLLASDPVAFAANTLVIVTAPGNPKHVASFADLAAPSLNVVVCQRPVPCGAATARVEDSTGTRLHPVSEEPSVTDALNKVTSGQADAALVYITDARTAGSKVATVTFPEAAGAVNVYPIATLRKSPQSELARKFLGVVTGDVGQQILREAGFVKP